MSYPRLFLGDCLEQLANIPDASIDMVFADLPYGATANKWDTPINLDALWPHLLRVGKHNAPFIFTATQPFTTTLINSQPKLFRYDLIWKKSPTRFHHAKRLPLAAHEHVLLFGAFKTYTPIRKPLAKPYKRRFKIRNGGPNYRPSLKDQAGVEHLGEYTHSYPTTIIDISQKSEKRQHPTQKPVALLEWLIKTYSNPGDTILDPVMGSGTTGVACLNTGRQFIGIEKDPAYFAVAETRITECSAGAA